MTDDHPSLPTIPEALLTLAGRQLTSLPIETRFYLEVSGVPTEVVVTTAELPEPRASSSQVVFDAVELAALVEATEADRVWPADLTRFCLDKRLEASWRLDRETALSGAMPIAGEPWSLSRLLKRWGAELKEVRLVEQSRQLPCAGVSRAA